MLPLALAHMMQVLPRPLLHMLPRRLMKFCPIKMLQLLGLWRLHRGRAPGYTGISSAVPADAATCAPAAAAAVAPCHY